ncbi:MAG: CoA-binding protein [Halococcoides sp.]
MPLTDDDAIEDLLRSATTVAVVGCSSTPGKDAHDIPAYLDEVGYEVIPVNPYAEAVLGRDAYDSLSAVEEAIDVVDVFRPSEEVPDIVDEALDRDDGATIWLQLGIDHPEAVERAEFADRTVVADRCMKIEYDRLIAD